MWRKGFICGRCVVEHAATTPLPRHHKRFQWVSGVLNPTRARLVRANQRERLFRRLGDAPGASQALFPCLSGAFTPNWRIPEAPELDKKPSLGAHLGMIETAWPQIGAIA